MGKQHTVILEDGDDLRVIAKIPPSAFDPGHEVPAVAQLYRIIANSYGPTLKLVSLTDEVHTIRNIPQNLLDMPGYRE